MWGISKRPVGICYSQMVSILIQLKLACKTARDSEDSHWMAKYQENEKNG